jgi:MoaA/NifB/PqqE/SkfB family radical SAM enzyme
MNIMLDDGWEEITKEEMFLDDGYEYKEIEKVTRSGYNKDVSYDSIKKLADAGMKQINIHQVLYKENFDEVISLIDDVASDERLQAVNAIVFLAYKPKGTNAGHFTTIRDVDTYKKLIEHCEARGVNYGFDSCSAPTYIAAIQDRPNRKQLAEYAESCESSLFSFYINVHGEGFHCSFSEGERLWKGGGIDVLGAEDFVRDVWNHPLTVKYRNANIYGSKRNPYKDCGDCRICMIYPSINPW